MLPVSKRKRRRKPNQRHHRCAVTSGAGIEVHMIPAPLPKHKETQMEERQGLVPVSYLKTRGWTKKLIAARLGKPDRFADNPHCYGGRDVQLYAMKRVRYAEKSAMFTKHLKRRSKTTESVDVSEFFS